MDNVVLDIPNGRKIRLRTTIVARIPKVNNGKQIVKSKKFKFDTGAQFTCLNADELSIDLCEGSFKKTYHGKIVEGTGIDSNTTIDYYLIQVDNFIVAGIDFGSVPIYITFDSRAHKRLLGFDIIRLMNINFDFDNKKLTLSKTKQFIDFKKRKLLLEPKDMLEMGIYDISDNKHDIDLLFTADKENP